MDQTQGVPRVRRHQGVQHVDRRPYAAVPFRIRSYLYAPKDSSSPPLPIVLIVPSHVWMPPPVAFYVVAAVASAAAAYAFHKVRVYSLPHLTVKASI